MENFTSVYQTLLESGHISPIPTKGVDSVTRMGCEIFEYLSSRVDADPNTPEFWNQVELALESFNTDKSTTALRSEMKKISYTLTKGITEDYKSLVSNVAPMVDGLVKDIEERTNIELKMNGSESLIEDFSHGDDLLVFSWDAATYPASRFDVIDHIRTMARSSNTKENIFDLKNAIKYGMKGTHTVKNVSIPRETINSVVSEPVRGIDFDPEQMKILFPIATSKVAYDFKVNRLLEAIEKPSVDMFRKISNDVVDLFDLIGIIRNNLSGMELSTDAVEQMGDNIRALTDLTFAHAYYLSYFKNVQYENTIIIDKNTVNGPVLAEYEKSGGTLNDVGIYLHGLHSEIPVPGIGVSKDVFLEKLSRARNMSKQKDIAVQTKASRERMGATQRAFGHVMENFVSRAKAEDIPTVDAIYDGDRKRAMLKVKSTTPLVRHNEVSIEDRVYSIVLDFFYRGSNIEKMYGDYASIHSDLKAKGNITERDISYADSCVFSNCAVSFLTDALCG